MEQEGSWLDCLYVLKNTGVVLAEVSTAQEAMDLQAYLAGLSQSAESIGYRVERYD